MNEWMINSRVRKFKKWIDSFLHKLINVILIPALKPKKIETTNVSIPSVKN